MPSTGARGPARSAAISGWAPCSHAALASAAAGPPLLVSPGRALGRDTAPSAAGIAVRGAAKPFAGDRPMFTTIAPGVSGRDTASVLFRLERRARVRLDAVRTGIGTSSVRWTTEATLGPGAHAARLAARPPTRRSAPTSCASRSRATASAVSTAGAARRAPTARVRRSSACSGVEAAFMRRSYLPEERDGAADPRRRAVAHAHVPPRRVRAGPEPARNDEIVGLEMGDPVRARLEREALGASGRSRSRRATGRAGSTRPGSTTRRRPRRVRAVRPPADDAGRDRARPSSSRRTRGRRTTSTTRDGDGWGDTWYAGGIPPVDLDRPYRDRGVPPRLPALRPPVPPLARADAARARLPRRRRPRGVRDGDELRAPLRPRRLPGPQRVRDDARLRRHRALPRPRRPPDVPLGEQLLLEGRARRPGDPADRAVARPRAARGARCSASSTARTTTAGARRRSSSPTARRRPWLFEGTGLENGDLLGEKVGGYGIEIDMTTPLSPPGHAGARR